MDKMENEKRILKLMIETYCKKQHTEKKLCKECAELLEYANQKTENCPLKKYKTFCSNCSVHCYKEEMRDKIRKIMRFSGPRMIFYHPIIAVKHVILSKTRKVK